MLQRDKKSPGLIELIQEQTKPIELLSFEIQIFDKG